MKKVNLIILCMFCLLLVGCTSNKTKEVSTLENFHAVCENNGFTTRDKLSDYSAKDATYITGANIATLDDATIEMVTYDSEENADKTQQEHIASFMAMKGTGSTINKEKGKNYYKLSMISNNYYMVSSRVENTLVFSKTPLTNKEKIETILNDMGY